ncbi:DUF481 domain-containing protein [Rubripirellula reticaptiva]|uniref:Mucin-like protein n=1 Tax=Rubripirellula reticaptiva TaxID=2528013 RepID=A0A5C6F1L2_9BACT|nr:DUF481 domain-containing protein [Rubripirellula reticaptiva]TWU55142.1 hypothetical protein Poly59_14380 [Rubripirellula reticaptiva]
MNHSEKLFCASALLAACCCLLSAKNAKAETPADSASAATPLWMQGVSTFNGSGYDLPASATSAASSTAGSTSVTSPATAPAASIATTHSVPSTTASTAVGTEATKTSTPAYTVPVDPNGNARLNPYVGAAASMVKPVSAESDILPLPFVSPSDLNQSYMASSPNTPSTSAATPELPPALESFNQEINDATVGEVPPLQNQVVRWYQYPQRWMKGWDSNAEFGIDGSGGNAETLALQTGLELKRKTDQYTFAIDVDYRQASSRDVTTEDNGRFNLDYDRVLGNPMWSAFGKFGLEWDKFKAFDLRVNTNAGLAYNWIRTDDITFITRFGAGASKEIGSPDDSWTPEAVFGFEGERQLTERQKFKAKVDYFPAWDDFTNYRLVADASWEILLDGSDNLSLKLAATDRYDSTPQGAKPNDIYYSLLLLYKF